MATFPGIGQSFEEFENEEHLKNFYGDFSSQVRKRLLSTNIKRPDNLFEILYNPVRKSLLSKNNNSNSVFNGDLDEKSKSIRDGLLSKQIIKDINIEKDSETFRKAALSKNELIKSTIDLEKTSENIRKSLLSKNIEKDGDLVKNSEKQRNNLESKNVSKITELESFSEDARKNLLSKNNDKNQNLEKTSSGPRNNLLSKNNSESGDLEKESENTRNSLLSKNKLSENDLGTNSETSRENLLSKNTSKNQDLVNTSESSHDNLISKNKPSNQDLEKNSSDFRENLISKNKENNIDLENSGKVTRENIINKNTPTNLTIDSSSELAKNNLLSKNTPDNHSLERESESFRKNIVNSNVSKNNDLEKDSESSRNNLLSKDVSKNSDLENSSENSRNNLLSSNKTKNQDLENNSINSKNNLLSKNVVNNKANPEENSDDFRKINTSKNVTNPNANPEFGADDDRKNELSKNISNPNATPTFGADGFRKDLLSKNVPIDEDLERDSQETEKNILSKNVANLKATPAFGATGFRDNLLSKNIPSNEDLGKDSVGFEDNLISKNISNPDANPETVGGPAKDNLLSKNISNSNANPTTAGTPAKDNLISKNVSNPDANPETVGEPAKDNLLSKNIPKDINLERDSNPFRHNLLSKNDSDVLGGNVFSMGSSTFLGISDLELKSIVFREALKFKNTIFNRESKLQFFYGNDISSNNSTATGKITDAALTHNLENNTFSINDKFNQGSQIGLATLTNHSNEGFQDLIQKTIGSLNKFTQVGTNSTPASIIAENDGQYLQSGAEQILKPFDGAVLGTAESMMSQTMPSDIIQLAFDKDNSNRRGVRNIINTIKKSNITFAANYDSQNTKAFVIGTNKDGSFKKSFQRFTIANPYQPSKEAGTLEFRITNYAIPHTQIRTMSFPPYIKSFNHSDTANWSESVFLGRPEPVYTYSSGNRKGTIEFIVLTDYASAVDIGVDFQGGQVITENFENHFTGRGLTSKNKDLEINSINSIIKSKEKIIQDLNQQKNNVGSDTGELSGINNQISNQQSSISKLNARIDELNSTTTSPSDRLFSESENGKNVYSDIGTINTENVDEIIRGPEDTKTRLDNMKKDLLFQPAFFSGDKVDFLNRMEFIAKLTKPSRNTSGEGISFINPPVCHVHLGDWINTDVIIDSVSYNYDDSPWTFDDGRTQPMYATITLSFSIIGTYGAVSTEDVPLSSDSGGFFQRRISV